MFRTRHAHHVPGTLEVSGASMALSLLKNDMLLDITSRMHARDIDKLSRSAEDDEQQEGVRPTLMVATSYVSPNLM